MRAGVVPLLLAVALVGCGGAEPASAPVPAEPVRAAAKPAELPPLPDMKPRVVEPVAGGDAAADVRDEAPAPAPDRPASRTRPKTLPANAGGDALRRATALPNGVALPPLEAPEEVKQIIEAGNAIARTPYKWGGGHGKWLDTGYDCSGSVSFALAAAGLIDGPQASGPLMSWGKPGRGRWVTIYTHPGHVFMEVAGIRFDTSGARETGSRWQGEMRSTAGFVARHPPGL
jgi:cell wall-associated NlpC family hydrolase